MLTFYIVQLLAFLPRYSVASQPVFPPQCEVDPLSIGSVGRPRPYCLSLPGIHVSKAMVGRIATHMFYLEDDLYNTESYLGWICIHGIWQPLEKHLCETPYIPRSR